MKKITLLSCIAAGLISTSAIAGSPPGSVGKTVGGAVGASVGAGVGAASGTKQTFRHEMVFLQWPLARTHKMLSSKLYLDT
jgi:hypothetical protein